MQNFMSRGKNMIKYKNKNRELSQFEKDFLTCFKLKKSLDETLKLMAHEMATFIIGVPLKEW